MLVSIIVQRRDYLVATGAVAATAPGVGRRLDAVAVQEDQTEQADEQADPIAQAGQFELVGLEAPDEVVLMTPFTRSYTVANREDEDATFWTYLTIEAWGETFEYRHGVKVPANAEVAVETNHTYAAYVGTIRYHLQAFEESFSVDAVPATSDFGTRWRSPEDIAMTITEVEFTDTFEYEDSDGSTAETSAPEGAQWAVGWIQVENVANEIQNLPDADDITVRTNGQRFERTSFYSAKNQYAEAEVGPGITREGWIVYKIPAAFTPEDIAVTYRDTDRTGEWIARWVVPENSG